MKVSKPNFSLALSICFFTILLMCDVAANAQDLPSSARKREFAVNVTPKSTTLNNALRYYVRWYTSENNAVRVQVVPLASWIPGSGAFPNLTGLSTSLGIERGKKLNKIRFFHGLQADYSIGTSRAKNVVVVGTSPSQGIIPESKIYSHEVGVSGIVGVQYYFEERIFAGIESGIRVGHSFTNANKSMLRNEYSILSSPVYGILVGYSF